ncbi:hypothetical protein D3C83_98930 [compost metagenome]
MKVEVKVIDAFVLGADILLDRRIVPAPHLLQRQRPVERVRVVHRHDRGHALPVRRDGEALDDMQLLAVRRAEGIDVAVLG